MGNDGYLWYRAKIHLLFLDYYLDVKYFMFNLISWALVTKRVIEFFSLFLPGSFLRMLVDIVPYELYSTANIQSICAGLDLYTISCVHRRIVMSHGFMFSHSLFPPYRQDIQSGRSINYSLIPVVCPVWSSRVFLHINSHLTLHRVHILFRLCVAKKIKKPT